MSREFERLARDAAASNQAILEFLLRLTESELSIASAAAISARIKDAKFPVLKDFDVYDFSVLPQLSKPKVLELARCEWIEQKYNCCLLGATEQERLTLRSRWGKQPVGRAAGAILHGGGAGDRAGEGPEAVHA